MPSGLQKLHKIIFSLFSTPMNEFLKDTMVKLLMISAILLNIGLFLFFYFFIKRSDIPIVLHYNVDWGVDYFGEVKNIFILPLIGLIIFLLNGVLALRLWFRMKSLAYFIAAITLISEIFLWLAGIALYIINS
ncbi:hypothetical protein A2819_01650 [Candidatus Azambacteria bacterium RIFCSPHIGHO2_01_FULL_40_24]|uniref:DUF1648 domain-containing protein n=1 Tax=Candidatus Azambacteria bacterium RIFCSPHIGHO2_01_FULL_40_24 TaxID=1797301 RepID=A0A1F5B332_9BACT|nr:MAG: hypothetical protein A2819_01650 [Candidatus Azambacteria bacterium RIFCSPHIGHO2_01_FULL_40_24]